MQSNSICLNCHKSSEQNVVLKCDHQLCMNCADNIKTLENHNPFDIKYKIACPYCKTNTITLNIANLISQEHDKLVFVNMEESELSQRELQKNAFDNTLQPNFKISKLKEMSYTDRIAALFTDRRTPELHFQTGKRSTVDASQRERGTKSRQGYEQNSDSFEIQCSEHKQQNIIFYCRQQNSLLCMQCMYKHMKEHKNHSISSIKDAIGTIQKQNMKYRNESRKVMQQIDELQLLCKQNKSKLQQAYIFLDQMIKKQFRELEQLLKTKQKEVNDFLEKTFLRHHQELKNKIDELNQTKSVLNDYYRYQIHSLSENVYFFSNYQEVKNSLQQYPITAKITELRDQDLLCFHRNSTTKDFEVLIEKLFVPKIQGRQSAQRSSRANSRNNFDKNTLKTDQLKQIPEESLKLAKKKMKQINRKIDSSRDFKKDKKYQFLQNLNLGEAVSIKKVDKGSSLNQRKPINAWSPTPQFEKIPSKKNSIARK